ncbi:MAG: aspartate kinase [Candidatus Delongbacteria bacterium]|nr:aspartate kinase [Candidatus Delongbacteria bacterium]MBN2835843.1 aspartate kinase [Candidatus Delongbacteria bacterium]
MLRVEKIGGTSMSRFKEILQNIFLYENKIYGRIFVVSAYSGVTDILLENKKNNNPGVFGAFPDDDYLNKLDDVEKKLKEINFQFEKLGLDIHKANLAIENRVSAIADYLKNLDSILCSGYVEKNNIILTAREILAGLGEFHSAYNTTEILKSHGINAKLIDLSCINDKNNYTVDQRLRNSVNLFDPEIEVPIITGYVKGVDGLMREFDRGYSEITFAKIAVYSNSNEAIIHKEYNLSSADPKIVGVSNCKSIRYTNYDVADQLADIGMEAIHPKASKLLEKSGIDLIIKNSFKPEDHGTIITSEHKNQNPSVEIISGCDKVILIDVFDSEMVLKTGFDLNIMEELKRHNISYIMKSTSANSISFVIHEKDFHSELIKQLSINYDKVSKEEIAIVSVIGASLNIPGILFQISKCMFHEKINIKAVSVAYSQTNVQFVISRANYRKAIITLNNEFFIK